MKNKIKIGSLFSGIGSFEYALEKVNINHDVIFASDNGEIILDINYDQEKSNIKKLSTIDEKKEYINKLYTDKTRKRNYMMEMYLNNYDVKNSNFFYDVKLLDGSWFENEIDILVGGSPCQSFSTIGKSGGFEDTRGTLFFEYARILKETKPKFFIYENVRGLTTHDKGKTFQVVKNTFRELGYHIKHEILNSKKHGLPQNRNRIFIIGFLDKNHCDKFEFPIEENLSLTMHDLLESRLPFGSFNIKNGKYNIGEHVNLTEVMSRYFLTPGVEKYVMSTGTKTYKVPVKIDLDVARPILKTMANHHRAGVDNYVKEFDKIRMLTEREALRLQGFGDDFKINVSPAQTYKMAGNTIPVNILMKIFNNMKFFF